jgi:hypothetical protein
LASEVIKDLHRRGLSTVSTKGCHTEIHGTYPNRHLPVGNTTGPGNVVLHPQTSRLLLKLCNHLPIAHEYKLRSWVGFFDEHHRIQQTREALISVKAPNKPDVRTSGYKTKFEARGHRIAWSKPLLICAAGKHCDPFKGNPIAIMKQRPQPVRQHNNPIAMSEGESGQKFFQASNPPCSIAEPVRNRLTVHFADAWYSQQLGENQCMRTIHPPVVHNVRLGQECTNQSLNKRSQGI